MRYSRYLRPKWAAALALMAATALINSSHAASLVSAGSLTGDFSVGVEFDEPLDAASATLASNYEVSGATISSAVLRSDRIVELAVATSVAEGFTVTVNGVNTATGTPISGSVTGELSELIPQDLGSPASAGKAIFTGDSYWVAAGGNDIYGTADNGFFLYSEHTGSFDVRARVESLVEGDEWGKAGLMVRENLGGPSRNQMVLITKNGTYPPYRDGGVNVYNHQWRDAEAGSSGSLATDNRITPTVFPSWLRLVRETASSQEIYSFISYDGEEWLPLASHPFPPSTTGGPFPETVYIGMAATAHDNNQDATPMAEAVISDFQIHASGFDDNEPPVVVSASGNRDLNTLMIVFSENMDPTTASDPANYTVSPSLTLSNPRLPVPNTVVFTTAAQTQGSDYTVTINGVADDSPQANLIAADSQATFKAWQLASGFLTAEFFTDITGTPVANLTNSQKYINNVPDDVRFLPNADTPNGYGNDYGLRLTGWLVPKESGNYYFFIRSDDASQLYINDFGEAIPDPMSDFPDAEETDCCGAFVEPFEPNEDGTFATTMSAIPLEQGKRYGFLFLMKEGTGEDWSQVAWRLEGDTTPAAELQPISGEFFETMVDATGSALSITTQPVDVSVRQNRPASFSVAVDSSSPDIGYQWLKDGVEIPGARGATYQIEAADAADNGSEYSIHLRIPGVSVTSDVATLTVNTDETAPVVLGAGAFEGGSTVGVGFDEPLDEATATDPANYTVSGANVTAATLHAGRVVELTLDGPVASGFTVTITDVADVLENAITSVVADGIITDMVHQDLGTPGTDPIEPGRAFTWGTGFFIGAGGNDIWDTDDAGHIIYKEFTGSFDMKARMDSLINGDEWGKVGLMVRESLTPGSRNDYIAITKSAPQINPPTPLEPHIGGVNVYTHQWRDTIDAASVSKPGAERISPTVFPSWLRLVRESTESNEIKSYISYDGEEWLLYHTHTIPNELLPETLFLGIAATSHDNAVGFPLVEGVVEGFSIVPFSQAVDPNLSVIAEAGGDLVISWEIGTLVASPTVNGTYEPVAGAISPYNVTAAGTAMFYQVQTSP